MDISPEGEQFKLCFSHTVAKEGDTIDVPIFVSAPEVLVDAKFSQMSDVWCVGLVLYLLINGKYPFSMDTQEMIKQILKGDKLDIFEEDEQLNESLNLTTEERVTVHCKKLLASMLAHYKSNRLPCSTLLESEWFKMKTLSQVNLKEYLNEIEEINSKLSLDSSTRKTEVICEDTSLFFPLDGRKSYLKNRRTVSQKSSIALQVKKNRILSFFLPGCDPRDCFPIVRANKPVYTAVDNTCPIIEGTFHNFKFYGIEIRDLEKPKSLKNLKPSEEKSSNTPLQQSKESLRSVRSMVRKASGEEYYSFEWRPFFLEIDVIFLFASLRHDFDEQGNPNQEFLAFLHKIRSSPFFSEEIGVPIALVVTFNSINFSPTDLEKIVSNSKENLEKFFGTETERMSQVELIEESSIELSAKLASMLEMVLLKKKMSIAKKFEMASFLNQNRTFKVNEEIASKMSKKDWGSLFNSCSQFVSRIDFNRVLFSKKK